MIHRALHTVLAIQQDHPLKFFKLLPFLVTFSFIMNSGKHENRSSGNNKNIGLFIFSNCYLFQSLFLLLCHVVSMKTVPVLVQADMDVAFSTAHMGKVSCAVPAPLSLFPRWEVVNHISPPITTLDGITLASSTTVRNLGVIFVQDLSFNSHIKQISRTAFFHLHNIAKIRHILSQNDAVKLVHAFVTSRLDYCN